MTQPAPVRYLLSVDSTLLDDDTVVIAPYPWL